MKLTLKPFKRFNDFSLEFAPLTLLPGLNCGGKTSVLQALIIGRVLATMGPEDDAVSALRKASRTGLPLGEPHEYAPYDEDEACVDIHGSDWIFEYTLRRDDHVEWSAANVPERWRNSTWRISTLASVPIDSEQRADDRSLVDGLFDGQHALIELADRGLGTVADPSTGVPSPLRSAVEKNLSELSASTLIQVERISGLTGLLKLAFRARSIESEWTSPVHHGAGITAILPVVVHLCAAEPGDTIILQDPEVNLHPRGQSVLGGLFVKVAQRGVRLIIESHSEHILNGIRVGLLDSDREFASLFVCWYLGNTPGGGAMASRIEFDNRGRILNWPPGFFDQAEIDLGTILRSGRP